MSASHRPSGDGRAYQTSREVVRRVSAGPETFPVAASNGNRHTVFVDRPDVNTILRPSRETLRSALHSVETVTGSGGPAAWPVAGFIGRRHRSIVPPRLLEK